MSTLVLHVRSFHPLTNFGLGGLFFHGDGRGFSSSVSVTSRIKSEKHFNLAAASSTAATVVSDVSSHPFGMSSDYSDPGTQPHATLDSAQIDPYRPDGDQGLQSALAYTGQNFAMPWVENDWMKENIYDHAVPGLDVMFSLHLEIDRDEKKMSFSFRMVGDGFPNAEAFLLDGANAPLMLATHRRVGSALHQLRGNRRIAMTSTAGEVDFDNDLFGSTLTPYHCLDYATFTGSQIDVFEETSTQPTSRTAWNSMHTGRDAVGDWVRLTQDRAMPTFVPGRSGSSMP